VEIVRVSASIDWGFAPSARIAVRTPRRPEGTGFGLPESPEDGTGPHQEGDFGEEGEADDERQRSPGRPDGAPGAAEEPRHAPRGRREREEQGHVETEEEPEEQSVLAIPRGRHPGP
jgi:hypothetical protein